MVLAHPDRVEPGVLGESYQLERLRVLARERPVAARGDLPGEEPEADAHGHRGGRYTGDDGRVRIHLDASARAPLSVQLRDGLVARIERGTLLPGERLPPVRDLAASLDVAANTVAKAYRELESSGYLVTRGRHGTFVADRLPE